MTEWKMPRGVKRHPLPPEALLGGVQKPAGRRNSGTEGKSPFVGPVIVTVPFDALVPDNQKYGARAIKTPHGKIRAGLFLSADYRAAKGRIEGIARRVMRDMGPCASPVHVDFECWMPDRRQRDMMNYAKILCDALKGICFEDDSLIYSARWDRKGIHRDAPAIVVTIHKP